MDAPAQPLHLRAHIADILRVYRATIHSATNVTPYELMKKAVEPSLFTQLQLKHKETIVPDRKRVKVFKIGDKVLVFDKSTKLNSLGTVVNTISKNSYTVDINGVSKHISGDNMSHTVIIDNDNDNENEKDNVSSTGSDTDTDTDSNSVISDDEFYSNTPVNLTL